MPKPKQEPTWQPLSQLPMIAYMIDGMTNSAEEQLVNMGQAEERPHVLDNATLDRLTQVWSGSNRLSLLNSGDRAQIGPYQPCPLQSFSAGDSHFSALESHTARLCERMNK